MKTLSTLLILFIGLNLAASGLAAGLCTGQSDCLHCAFQPPSQSQDMPMGQPMRQMGHGCCATPENAACDFEKNSLTPLSVVCLLPTEGTTSFFSSVAHAGADIPFLDIDNKNQSLPPQHKRANRKTPIFIQHLSLIC